MCNRHPHVLDRRSLLRLAGGLGAAALLGGCGRSQDTVELARPAEIDRDTVCALDGMLLADYPGPKAQIHYAGSTGPEFHCDLAEMFHLWLNPESVRQVRAMYVQDMGAADWDAPEGHWIEARSAWYVYGSSRHGAMGPAIASFASEAGARKFAGEFGGTVSRFDGIKADQVILNGGALHDRSM